MDTRKGMLIGMVGEENVHDDPETLESYSRDHSFAPPLKPWFVVRPKSVAEVQALVKWANETATPLIPVSSGPPRFHGDTVPSVPEGVVVDLRRMKAIKKIDRRNRMVIIEPGVTYSDLDPALAQEGLRISRPLLPRPNKSVIGSLLERQPTTIPRFNFSLPDPLRNCGVVWGTGELAFTGEAGSGPLSLEAQWQSGGAQVDPKGPGATDLMRLLTGAQGSMGIVVWASIKCELTPKVHEYAFVPGDRLEDLIDFCYRLERIRLGDEVMIVNRTQLARMLGKEGTQAGLLPSWVVIVGLAGAGFYPEERVRVQELDLQRLAQTFHRPLLRELPQVAPEEIAAAVEGCSGESYWKLKSTGACRDIFFLTTLDKTPRFLTTVQRLAESFQYPVSGIGVYIQPQHQGVSQHLEFSFPFAPDDGGEAAKVKALDTAVSQELIAQGAYFSRPYGSWAEMVYSRDATATRVLRTVKQIVDPNHILNPGKLCF